MSSSKFHRLLSLFGWLLLVPSGLAALALTWFLGSSLAVGSDMRSLTGRVVGHEAMHLKRNAGQRSVVEFTAHDGRILRVVDPVVRQGGAIHKTGETVKLRYPERDAAQAQIESSVLVQVAIGSVLLLFSVVGVLAGLLLLRLRPRNSDAVVPV